MKDKLRFIVDLMEAQAARYGNLSRYDLARLTTMCAALSRPLVTNGSFVRIGNIEAVYAALCGRPCSKQNTIEWLDLDSPAYCLSWRIERA